MGIKNFINEEVLKLHKKTMLESQLKDVNKKLTVLKEGAEKTEEEPAYQKNTYADFRKDLEETVRALAEACNKLESAALRQESHMKSLPEVEMRMEEGKKHKQVILDIYKEVKSAKIAAERKLYEMS